jgi:hypothetical protein
LGEQRVKFSTDIVEVADDVQIMCKDTEKSRKQVKEIGLRHDRNRQESESALDKVLIYYYKSSFILIFVYCF